MIPEYKKSLFPEPPFIMKEWRILWENGDVARAVPDSEGAFDLKSISPKGVDGAELSIDFDMKCAGFLIIGLGVDWFCEAAVNGETVYSSMEGGNVFYPPAADNHIVPAFVNAGRNTLVVRSRAGSASWKQFVRFYSPDAAGLRRLSRLKLSEYIFSGGNCLEYEPIVTPVGVNCVKVTFITSQTCGGGVMLRRGSGECRRHYECLGGRIACDSRIHHVEIQGLVCGEQYQLQTFAVDAESGEETLLGEARNLKIPAENDNVRFFVFGDLHRTVLERRALLSDYWRNCGVASCDVVVSLGDFVSASENFESECLGGLDDLQTHDKVARQFVILRGNHEMRGREADAYFRYFAPDGCGWGACCVGDVACIWLDACECDAFKPQPNSHTYLNVAEKEYLARQREWLEAFLESDGFLKARFRIVFCHGMPVAVGRNTYMPDNLLALTDGLLTGTSPKASIDLWVAGHVHNYKHFDVNEISGIPFAVMCTDGPDYGGRNESAFIVDVDKEGIKVRAVERNGSCFDSKAIAARKE